MADKGKPSSQYGVMPDITSITNLKTVFGKKDTSPYGVMPDITAMKIHIPKQFYLNPISQSVQNVSQSDYGQIREVNINQNNDHIYGVAVPLAMLSKSFQKNQEAQTPYVGIPAQPKVAVILRESMKVESDKNYPKKPQAFRTEIRPAPEEKSPEYHSASVIFEPKKSNVPKRVLTPEEMRKVQESKNMQTNAFEKRLANHAEERLMQLSEKLKKPNLNIAEVDGCKKMQSQILRDLSGLRDYLNKKENSETKTKFGKLIIFVHTHLKQHESKLPSMNTNKSAALNDASENKESSTPRFRK